MVRRPSRGSAFAVSRVPGRLAGDPDVDVYPVLGGLGLGHLEEADGRTLVGRVTAEVRCVAMPGSPGSRDRVRRGVGGGSYAGAVDLEFSGEVWFWRGPSPWHFVTVPEEECAELEDSSAFVSYGWGMIPVAVRIGETEWTTSLWPKDGSYVVPLKAAVRKAEGIDVGDVVSVRLAVDV